MAYPAVFYVCESLPLMRKTFIEAFGGLPSGILRLRVSSAYAEDFH